MKKKCIKGQTCLHCDTSYCLFADEVKALKADNENLTICIEMQRMDETKQYIAKTNFERENHTLKKTLKEIQEIASEQIKGVSEDCIKTTPFFEIFKKIQDKTREVLDE